MEWKETLGEIPSLINSSPAGFIAAAVKVGRGSTLWWSTDGTEWIEIAAPSESVVWGAGGLMGTAAGMAWVTTGPDGIRRMAVTTNGREWTESTIELPGIADTGDYFIRELAYINGRWVVLAGSESTMPPREVHTWTSFDGEEWTYRGIPPFGSVPDAAVFSGRRADAGDLLIIAPTLFRLDEPDLIWPGEVWGTADGITWELLLEDQPEVHSIAARRNRDGSVTAVIVPEDPAG